MAPTDSSRNNPDIILTPRPDGGFTISVGVLPDGLSQDVLDATVDLFRNMLSMIRMNAV